MSAHGEAIGRAGASRRAKDIGFQALLLFCIGLSVLLLGVLLVDIVIDGAGGLTWDFINNFTSIDAGTDARGLVAGSGPRNATAIRRLR